MNQLVSMALRKATARASGPCRIDVRYGKGTPASQDAERLQEAVSQVVLRAILATHSGESSGRVRIVSDSHGGMVHVRVWDDGPTFDSTSLDAVMQPCRVAVEGDTHPAIGLAFASAVVREFGGRFEVKAEPMGGTTVAIQLPAEGASAGPTAANDDRASIIATPRNVLVVDDDPMALRHMVKALGYHHRVAIAAGPAEALARLQESPTSFDVIVADVGMPDASGVELYADVQKDHPEVAARFLFVLGDEACRADQKIVRRLGLPVIHKPFRAEALRDAVARVPVSRAAAPADLRKAV